MFVLKVTVTPQLNGLRALDERRRLGLPDGVFIGEYEYDDNYTFKFDVSESFARNFPDVYMDDTEMTIGVPTSSFRPGEIVASAKNNDFDPGPGLNEARLLELAKASKEGSKS